MAGDLIYSFQVIWMEICIWHNLEFYGHAWFSVTFGIKSIYLSALRWNLVFGCIIDLINDVTEFLSKWMEYGNSNK